MGRSLPADNSIIGAKWGRVGPHSPWATAPGRLEWIAAGATVPEAEKANLEAQEARLEDLYNCHRARIFDYAAFRGASIDEAEEVVEEVFVVCWRNLSKLEHDALPWLYGVTRKVLANQRKKRRRREARETVLSGDEPSLDSDLGDGLEQKLAAKRLLKGLSCLSEKDRETLLLVGWDGLKVGEAARALGCSETAFAVRVHRARRRLLGILAESEGTTGLLDHPLLREMEPE